MRICMENMALVKRDVELVSVLKTHEPVAWNLLEESWTKSIGLQAAKSTSNTEQRAEIDRLRAECEQLKNGTKSEAAAVVKYGGADLCLEPKPSKSSVQAIWPGDELSLCKAEASRLTQKNQDLKRKLEGLRKGLRQENGKRRNEQHNAANTIKHLQDKLKHEEDMPRRLIELIGNLTSLDAEGHNSAKARLKQEMGSLR